MVLGASGASTGTFLAICWCHFGIKNRKNGMSKNDRMEPGSQTPPWDALGSILGSFLVDFGHRFWTKKTSKIYEQICTPKVCENVSIIELEIDTKYIKNMIKYVTLIMHVNP